MLTEVCNIWCPFYAIVYLYEIKCRLIVYFPGRIRETTIVVGHETAPSRQLSGNATHVEQCDIVVNALACDPQVAFGV